MEGPTRPLGVGARDERRADANGGCSKLNEQQQRRITDNFRAARAILTRKRAHLISSGSAAHQTVRRPENQTPPKASHCGRPAQTTLGCRRPSPAKRMCTPTLPERNQRTPLKELSGNQKLPIKPNEGFGGDLDTFRPFTAGLNSDVLAMKGKVGSQNSNHLVNSVINRRIQTSTDLKSAVRSTSQSQAWRDSECLLPEDICEELDEGLLKELDDLCENQTKKPVKTPTEPINPTIKLPSRSLMPSYSLSGSMGTLRSEVSKLGSPILVKRSSGQTVQVPSTPQMSTGQAEIFREPKIVSKVHHPAFPCPESAQSDNMANALSMECLTSAQTGVAGESLPSEALHLEELLALTHQALVPSANMDCPHAEDTTSTALVSLAARLSAPRAPLSNSECVDPPLTAGVRNVPACDTPLVGSSLQDLPEYLRNLNESQREAALCDTSKPLLILAGPGSGKTSTMVARLLTLLREGIEARSILAMTFTTAAATEMRTRVGAATGKLVSKELSISTFHSFCLQLCRTHAEKLGRTAEFLVYGHGQQRRAVIEATRLATLENQTAQGGAGVDDAAQISDVELKTNGQDFGQNPAMWKDKAKKWQQFVTQAKAAGRTSHDYEKMGNKMGAAVLRHYEATLATCNALDYHDFITFAVHLLENHPQVLDECQKTWTCVLVDEFQDTSTMQYHFLRLLASHNRVTVVGDDDQSIFSFNGANASGFDSFRKDFSQLIEVRLHQNYRSTRSIVEAATSLIRHNVKRCEEKQAHTDNGDGNKIVVMECRTEAAQCSFVVDCIILNASLHASLKPSYGTTAVLYRRQVTGKMFQAAFRGRKIPFNVHGVAFYRKKVIKNVTSMLWTVLPGNSDSYWRRVFKALYAGDKSESKRVVEYVDKVAKSKKSSFHQAAQQIFTAKVSGTFSRRELALGRRVLTSIDMVHRLAHKERSLSGLITAVVNLLPQRPVFETRAVVDENGGKLLNEDDDPRTVLEYFLEDVNDFLSNFFNPTIGMDANEVVVCGQSLRATEPGCLIVLKAFLDHLVSREADNFQQRRQDNKNSVTLTTMHQSKGLEWDTVYIVKANDSETPLLHEARGLLAEGACSLEEERRLFYVAMTRARKMLYICYVVVDNQRQVLQPSRFLKEIPCHLLDFQGVSTGSTPNKSIPESGFPDEGYPTTPKQTMTSVRNPSLDIKTTSTLKETLAKRETCSQIDLNDVHNHFVAQECCLLKDGSESANEGFEGESYLGLACTDGAVASTFLNGFNIEGRSTVATLFNRWARKPAFQDPKRLISKVGFVVDERLRSKNTRNKDVMIALKVCLKGEAALAYAYNAIKWGQLPAEERALLQAERQEHFQQQCTERSMGAAAATPKQIAYLHNLGCTTDPTSRLHASQLIEQYKKL